MEVLAITIMLGILAKFVERKLEKSAFEKEWINAEEIPVQEKLELEAYS